MIGCFLQNGRFNRLLKELSVFYNEMHNVFVCLLFAYTKATKVLLFLFCPGYVFCQCRLWT